LRPADYRQHYHLPVKTISLEQPGEYGCAGRRPSSFTAGPSDGPASVGLISNADGNNHPLIRKR
jgi:hypothetical protein